jgi:hypothetical protein
MARVASLGCLACAAMWLASPAHAAEIVLEQTAVTKLVTQAVFADQGRYELLRGPCFAQLDQPTVSIDAGRIRIRSRLSARLGVADGASCRGLAVAAWTEVSGRPVARGGQVVLAEVRIDKVDDPSLQWLLESGLVPSLPGAVALDVQGAVRDMLQRQGSGYQAEVERFTIDSVVAADKQLTVRFDFKLLAR